MAKREFESKYFPISNRVERRKGFKKDGDLAIQFISRFAEMAKRFEGKVAIVTGKMSL